MRLSRQVLFPAFSKTFRESAPGFEPHLLPQPVCHRSGALAGLLGLGMTAGNGFVKFLLDHRFWEAGWIFQILCIRTAMRCLFNPLSNCCVAIDKTHSIAVGTVTRVIWVVIAVPLGWHVWGFAGVVWAVALSETPVLVILYTTLRYARIVRFGARNSAAGDGGRRMRPGIGFDAIPSLKIPRRPVP